MNKIFTVIIVVIMLMCITACNNQDTNPSNTTPNLVSSTEATSNTHKENNENITSNSSSETPPNNSVVDTTPSHTHNFSSATCTTPRTCSCGVAEGSALGHNFANATCTSAKKCSRCGKTEGSALGHTYSNGVCSQCGKVNASQQKGSRTNPAKIGDTITFEYDKSILGTGTVQITLTKVLRGDKAKEYVDNANSFNPSLPSGYEFVIAYFSVKNIKDTSEDQIGIKLNTSDFKYANSQYITKSAISQAVSVKSGEIPLLSGTIYEGVTNNGFVCFTNPSNENCYFVLETKPFDSSKDIWFAMQ